MKNNPTYEDLTGRYLDNEMSKTEKLDFESRMENDPQLKEEFNFQNDLVKAIKSHRKLELKARLSNIEVPTPILQAVGLKLAAIATATIIVGAGIYYYSQQDTHSTDFNTVDITKKQLTLQEENVEPVIPDVKIEIIAPTKTDENKTARNKKKADAENKVTVKKQKPIQPTVVKPKLNDDFDEAVEENTYSEETDANLTNGIKEDTKSKMEVETVKTRRHKFHYKFYNNRLYLLGDFSKSPYEIIELNSNSGKKYFLFYQENYYQLKTDQQKPTKLNKVENDSIIKELNIIQEYK